MYVQFSDNLKTRLQILATLHWSLPHGLTAAEELLRDTDLPNLDEQAQALKKQIKVIDLTA